MLNHQAFIDVLISWGVPAFKLVPYAAAGDDAGGLGEGQQKTRKAEASGFEVLYKLEHEFGARGRTRTDTPCGGGF